MYSPSAFPFLAAFFDHLLDGDTSSTEMITLRDELIRTTFPKVSSSIVTGQALVGIHCGDNNARVTTLEDFLPAAEELHRKSRIMGPTASLNSKTCPQWKIRPRERYDGNFTAKTKNPMLIVGNTWDPVTPLVSAKNVSTGFEGSVVLEVRGWGVSIFSFSSLLVSSWLLVHGLRLSYSILRFQIPLCAASRRCQVIGQMERCRRLAGFAK